MTLLGTIMAVSGRWSTPVGLVALAAVGAIGFLSRRVLAPMSARVPTLWKSKNPPVGTSDPSPADSTPAHDHAARDEPSARFVTNADS
jgi:hypothetical protein